MEYVQGILFTSKYILGRSGNTDIFYLFAAFVLLFYVWKRHDKLELIVKILIPFAVITGAMTFLYPWTDNIRCGIFLAKMAFNITLMVFVACNCKKWKIIRFIEMIVWIQAVETVIALILPNSPLWVTEAMVDGISVSRLQLFYMDAGSLAFASGLALVMIVYYIVTAEVIWKQVIGAAVMVFDLFLSYGMGGIVCALIAIVAMLGMTYVSKLRDHDTRKLKQIRTGIFFSIALTAGITVLNSTYLGRINGIVHGTDSIVNTKLISPLSNLGKVLKETHFLGVGFGNGNVGYALDLMNAQKAYPNSFLRIIAEGGIFGIALVLLCIIGLGYYCYKYGNLIDKALYIYIIVFQLTGGYFTNPTNFFVYGWIMGDCLNNQVALTGTCGIKLFIPKKKEKLKIAMIGHKRIPSREGGVEIVVEEISKRLVRQGHEVDAYNRSGQHVSGAEYNVVDYDRLKEYEGIKIIKIPTIQKKGFAALIYSFFASIYVVGKDYDVVHYHAEGPCAFMWIPSMCGIRTVCTIHGLDWMRSGKWGSMASSFIKLGERMAVYFADEMIVLSRHVQQYFLDNYNRKTVLIPNGANLPEKKEAEVITEKWGLHSDSYILSLSRMTREKCTDLLIKAFKDVQTDKKLVIAGGSSDSEEYVQMLHKLAEDDPRIIFTGFVQGREMEELYSNAYLYCLPSELEGMPLSLLEAMSYGNCCVVSDIAECAEVVEDKGVVFKTGDVESLKNKLQQLCQDSQRVENYKSEAAEFICRKYNWDDVVEKTLLLYKEG